MQPNEIIRIYPGSDAYLTETARATHALLTIDLPLFTAFDSTITAAYVTQFLSAITAAEIVVADTAVIDQQVQKTEIVLTNMDAAKSKYHDVKYFVQKAFPNSSATQGEFGLNDYERARKSTSQMVQFLDEMHKAAVKYQTQLVAKGFTASAITEIQTIRTALLNANTNQEVFKKQRPKLTEDRIKTLNTCHDYVTQINAAAQLVFKNDFAKQKQYIYLPSSETASTIYSGVIIANSTKNVATIAFSLDQIFTFRNTGIAPLVFCLSTSDSIEGIEVAIGGGAIITKTAGELNANATQLVIRNTDANNEGSYEVEINR